MPTLTRSSRRLALAGLVTCALTTGGLATPSFAANCDEPAAGVVFKDMLYGIGIGTILSGLYLISSSSDNDNGKVLGRGALVGGILGTGAGIYEVAVRNCNGMLGYRSGPQLLTTAIPTRSGWQPGYGVTWRANL